MKRCRALMLLALLLVWVSIPMTVFAEESSTVIGEDYVLEPGESIDQDLVIVGGTATLSEDSLVAGNVAVMGGELIVRGDVYGDIVAFGGTLLLDDTAHVTGDVISLGELSRHVDADISGNVVEGPAVGAGIWAKVAEFAERNPSIILPDEVRQEYGIEIEPPSPAARAASAATSVFNAIVRIMVLAGLAMLAVRFLPERLNKVNAVMRESAPISLGVGLLTYIAAVLISVVLVVICIGIPVAIALWLALALLNLVGWIAAGIIVGQEGLRIIKRQLESPLWVAAIGTALITLLSNVPCVGGLLSLLLSSWALGAILLSRLGTTVDTTWAPVVGQATVNANAPQANVAPPATADGPVETGTSNDLDVLDLDPLGELGLPLEPELDSLDNDDDGIDDDNDTRGTRKLN